MHRRLALAITVAVLSAAQGLGAAPAAAEANTVRAAKQWGLGYLQFMLMEDMKLVEKHAKAAGLGDVTVQWNTFRSSDVMNDALISGNVDFVSLGIPGLLTIWDRTKGSLDVKGVVCMNQLPLVLNVRAPDVKAIADFTEKHRIAVPAVKVSMQAILLQMAAEKQFGAGKHKQLDPLTLSMAHPDATVAMLGPPSEISANFSSPPFYFRQLKKEGIRRIASSTDINGGPLPFNVIATTSKFRTQNPKLYAAFIAAMDEATTLINKDKRWAAEAYIRIAKDKSSVDDFMVMMNDPEIRFTLAYASFDTMVDFMVRTGNFRNKPAGGQDLLFAEAKR